MTTRPEPDQHTPESGHAPEGTLYVAPNGYAYRVRGTVIDWSKAPDDGSDPGTWPRQIDYAVQTSGGMNTVSHDLPDGAVVAWSPSPEVVTPSGEVT